MNSLIDALPFADFATPEEIESAKKLTHDEMILNLKDAPEKLTPPLSSFQVEKIPRDLLGEIEKLKITSECLEIQSLNLDLSNKFETPAWIQMKGNLASLKEVTKKLRAENEESLSSSIKRRKLSQTIHAASIGQQIREWSNLIELNEQAEKVVAKLETEISQLIRDKKIPGQLMDEINELIVL